MLWKGIWSCPPNIANTHVLVLMPPPPHFLFLPSARSVGKRACPEQFGNILGSGAMTYETLPAKVFSFSTFLLLQSHDAHCMRLNVRLPPVGSPGEPKDFL